METSNMEGQTVITVEKSHSLLQNLGALALAMAIDFADFVPDDLLYAIGLFPVAIGASAAVSVVEAAYLNYLGVPIVKLLVMSGTDMLPFVDVIPWCTIAVLDRRFGLQIPLVTKLFNY